MRSLPLTHPSTDSPASNPSANWGIDPGLLVGAAQAPGSGQLASQPGLREEKVVWMSQ
jgi:hypothetical protein